MKPGVDFIGECSHSYTDRVGRKRVEMDYNKAL